MTVVVIALVLLGHGFLYLRAVHAVTRNRRARVVGSFSLTALAAVATTALLTRGSVGVDVARPLQYVGFGRLAVAMYLALLLAVGELVRLAARFVGGRPSQERRRFLSRVIAGTATVAALGTVTYGAVIARRPRLRRSVATPRRWPTSSRPPTS